MTQVVVRIPAPLRAHVEGRSELSASGATLGEVLADLDGRYPVLGQRLRTPDGQVRPYVNLFIGERNANALGGLAAALEEGAVISVLPAVAGGAGFS